MTIHEQISPTRANGGCSASWTLAYEEAGLKRAVKVCFCDFFPDYIEAISYITSMREFLQSLRAEDKCGAFY